MSNAQIISVLCVDDNTFVAEAVEAKLQQVKGFEWLGSLESADELVDIVAQRKPMVVLLDIDLPGTDPFVAVGRIAESSNESRVIMFSGHVRPDLLERAIEAGAWGYISKCDGESWVVDGIRRVAGGEFVMSPEVCSVCERG